MISKADAVERVRQYAAANGLRFSEPVGIRTESRPRDLQRPQSGKRTVYTMALGTTIPMPFVEVDAVDGTVLAWRQGSR
ncbi:MAG: hypothetical protein INR71_04210 [Terriglobus roseus]|nr:hypothetical protein [Terriglobus roseus]